MIKCKHNWCVVEGMMSWDEQNDCRLHWFICSECGKTKEVSETGDTNIVEDGK